MSYIEYKVAKVCPICTMIKWQLKRHCDWMWRLRTNKLEKCIDCDINVQIDKILNYSYWDCKINQLKIWKSV